MKSGSRQVTDTPLETSRTEAIQLSAATRCFGKTGLASWVASWQRSTWSSVTACCIAISERLILLCL